MGNRRRFIERGTAAAGATAITSFPHISIAQERPKVTYPTLLTGVTVIMNEYMTAKRFDLRHGVDLSASNSYTSVSAYYNDLAAGTFDLGIGSWDTFVELYQRTVPIKLVCTATTADLINIVAPAGGVKTVADLRGKSISAVVGSGSFTMTKAVLADLNKIELGKDVETQNVPSPAQAVTLLQAGNVAAALSWEPSISSALSQLAGSQSIFNLGHTYKAKFNAELPYFSVAIRNEVLKRGPRDLAKRIAGAFAECIDSLKKNPDEAFAIGGPKMGIAPAVLRGAFDAKRLTFAAYPMTEPSGRKLITDAYAYFRARGTFDQKPLGNDFFA